MQCLSVASKISCISMKSTLYILLFFISTLSFSQTIKLDIPTAYYMQYHLALNQGNLLDTIAVGRFDEKGRATFSIPEVYHSYRGVGKLTVTGLDGLRTNVIINGEDSITIKEGENYVLTALSTENYCLMDANKEMGKIMSDYNMAVAQVAPGAPAFGMNQFKVYDLQANYKQFWKEINNSPLYASRILELSACIRGIAKDFNTPNDSIVVQQHRYITDTVDFDELYTSGFWQMALDAWRRSGNDNDSLLVADARTMIDRTGDNRFLRRELTESLIRDFIRYGKDNLLVDLGTDYLTIPINGVQAPEIVVGDSTFVPKLSLILFYETGCGNCHNQLHQLKLKYNFLSNEHNRIRVITISADTDKDVNEDTASSFPWKDNICNLKGFNDPNFRNYGIMGTPTFILTDEEGIVRGRYAQLSEFLQ